MIEWQPLLELGFGCERSQGGPDSRPQYLVTSASLGTSEDNYTHNILSHARIPCRTPHAQRIGIPTQIHQFQVK